MSLFYHLLVLSFSALVAAYPSDSATFTNRVWPLQSFQSTPSFTPPVFEISKSGKSLAPGYIFLTPVSLDGAVQPAAIIMTDTGELIWNSEAGNYTSLVVQSLDSKPVLTYWTGGAVVANGYGHISIRDETYTEIYRVCPQAVAITQNGETFPCYADLHESYITERGSILVTMYNVTTADLRSVNGSKDGWVFDTLFFNVDIKTNKTLFRWSALEARIPFTDSKAPLNGSFGNGTKSNPWDWFHMNAVQSVGDGYIVNGRHLWTTFKLNSVGDIEWHIQGDTGGDFVLSEDGHFSWEHYARVENATSTDLILHYMNNFNAGRPFNGTGGGGPSEGLELYVSLINKTATVLKNLVDPKETIYNDAQGTFDPLPNGNTLLGYGQIPAIKEFGPDGNDDVRMTIWYGIHNNSGAGAQSYRTFRRVWVGTPEYPPVVVAESGVLYMSWNGATRITRWEILAGEDNAGEKLEVVGVVESMGFETMFRIPDGCAKAVRVAAYRGAELLRYSDVVTVA